MTDSPAGFSQHRDMWRRWGERFGWRLNGFTYMDQASFFLPSGALVEISVEDKLGIDRAIALAEQSGEGE